MAEFEAGEAYVSLVPSARGFSKQAEKDLAAAGDLEKTVDLAADKSKLEAAVKEARAELKQLNDEKANPSINLDIAVAEAKVAEFQAKLDELNKLEVTPKVTTQIAEAERDLSKYQSQLDALNGRKAETDVEVRIAAATATLQQYESRLDALNRKGVTTEATADISQARARLNELDGLLRSLDTRTASPQVQLQAAQAQQEALRIRAELDRLGAMRPTPQVQADVASASAKLAGINQQLSEIDGRRVSANVNADSSGRASLILGGVVAALGAIMSVAPAAAGALAAVGGAAGALGQGVAAGMAGFAGIGDALTALSADEKSAATASVSASGKRAAGTKQAEYAMRQLTESGRSMVLFLHNEWQPTWQKATDAVADAMLPKVEGAMRSLELLQPTLTRGLADTGAVLGDLAVKGSQLATSPAFQANFASIMASNNNALRSYGDAGISLFGAFTDLYAAAGPIIEEFARLADYSAQAFESWIVGARASGDLDRWLRTAADTLQYLGGWLVDVGGDVLGFAQSLAPLGGAILEAIRGITDWVSWLAQLSPGFTSVVVGAGLAAAAASKLGTAMSGMAIAQNAGGIRGFANVLTTVLNPAALYSGQTLTKLRENIGKVTPALPAPTVGGQRLATAMRGAGTAVSGLAAGFPLLAFAAVAGAAALDASTSSASEGAEAMMRGGQSAADMRYEIAKQTGALGENSTWIDRMFSGISEGIGYNTGLIATTRGVNEEVAKQRAQMTDLQRAQSLATEAQGNYEQALRESGPTSDRTKEAQRQLGDATAAVAQAQEDARRATMNATQALQDQQTKILGSIDARLALQQATQQVKQAQDDYAAAVRGSGAGSDEAKAALTRLEQSQSSAAQAALRAADAEGKRKGIVDTSALANHAYATSVGDMVAKTQGQLTPALAQMVQGLDGAGLSAAGAKVHIDQAGNAIAVFPNGKTVTLTAQTSPEFFAQLKVAQDTVNSTRGTIGVDADTGPGVATVGGFKLGVDATRGVVTINGDISLAEQQRLGIQAKTDGTTGTMWINGNPVPCDGKLNGMRVTVDQTTGVMQIDATDARARATLRAFQLFADWQVANPDLAADPARANQEMRGFLERAGRETGVPMLDADPARADQTVREAVDRYNREHPTPELHIDPKPAEGEAVSFWDRIGRFFLNNPFKFWNPGNPAQPGPFGSTGGLLVEAANGGAIGRARRPVGFPSGGRVRGPGTATSDSIPAMLSAGEFVVRARSVDAVGADTLHRINAMAGGGLVGYAAGGAAKPLEGAAAGPTAAPAPAGGDASVTVPSGDAAAASGAAGATDGLTGSMSAATAAAAALAPQLAAVTTQQQALVTTGVTPLAAALTGQLVPAVLAGNTAVGVQAPLAHAALQDAQVATQLSTTTTAANAALNNASIASTTGLMSAQGQAQHAGLRAGQVATQLSTNTTAANAAVNNAGIAATTAGMSLQAQAQHAGLRGGQVATQLSTNLTAQNAATNNAGIAATTAGMSVQAQAQHAGLRAGQGATQLSTNLTAQNAAQNNAGMVSTTTGMSLAAQLQHANLRAGQGATQTSQQLTAAITAGSNLNMQNTTGAMSAINQGHLGGLRFAQTITSDSTRAFADAWQAQLGRTVPDSANPIRWVIDFPMHSIVDAWNNLDGQFALGKHVNPAVPNFATGGPIAGPGTDTSDSIFARLSNNEFVINASVAKKTKPFLTALNSGDGEALQAAGGLNRVTPKQFKGRSGFDMNLKNKIPHFAAGGPADARIGAAKQWLSGPARGIPYSWGIWDCSGMQAAVTHLLSGRSPYSGRMGTTASMPWGGFVPGLTSAYAIGNKPSDHMAGTLAGQNVEQHGPQGTPFMFPSRWGADNPYFPQKWSLPVVGGQFVSGGAGGSFDPTPIVDAAFAKAYREIADVPQFFGPSDQVARDQGTAKFSADKIRQTALDRLMAMFASSGTGMDVSGISGPVVEQVRQVAARFGWGGGPEWDAIDRIVMKESSWDPTKRNASSGAAGLFQKMPMHGAVEPTPAGQAAWGLGYIRGKYQLPTKAWAFHQSHNWYDQGGMLQPGVTVAHNDTGVPERILNNAETRSYDTLTRLIGKKGMPQLTAPDAGRPIEVHVHPREGHDERNIADNVTRRLNFELAGSL